MNARVYANTTSLSLTSDLDGADFVPPVIPAGQDIHLRFRTSKEIEGTGIPDERAIRAVSVRMGWPGRPPEQGGYRLRIALGDDEATTGEIAHNGGPAVVAAAINTAIEGELPTLHPCTVTAHLDGMRIVFADNAAMPEIVCADNELWPLSFVEVDAVEFDAGWAYMLDLRQAPVAEAAGAMELVPDAPSVTELQVGGDFDGIQRNAIQKLAIPPDFSGGSFVLTRGAKSPPVPSPPTLEQVSAALAAIADEGGVFETTAVSGGVYIEFRGSMAGTDHDLIGVEVFESPGTEHLVRLPTDTAGVRELMRNADSAWRVEVPLNLDFEIADPATPGAWERKTIALPLTLSRPVSTGSRNVSADLRWDQPRARGDYRRHSVDSVVVGNRAMEFTIGDGVATSFVLAHNLVENPRTVTADAGTDRLMAAGHNYQDLDPVTFATTGALPAPLEAGRTYFVLAASTDDFRVSLAPNGPAIDLTTAGTGTHTARLKDGTVDGVDVSVWETGGDEERLSPTAYRVRRTSLDAVTLWGFAAVPTAGQYRVFVQTYGRPATYQPHDHEIDETPEAKRRIEDLEARVSALEAGNFPGGGVPNLARISGKIERPLPRVWRVPKLRTLPADPGTLRDWNPYGPEAPLREVRLLPAVHLAAENVEVLPSVLPAAEETYRGRVFYSATERADFPGGLLPAGGYAACDGREWYRVVRESEDESTWYPALFGFELFRLSVSPDELALRTRLDLAFGFECALLDPSRRPSERRTVARMSLLLERGVRTSDTAPGTPGSNIADVFADPVVLLRHDFDLTAMPVQKRFGLSIARSGSDVLTALATNLMQAAVPVSAPASADFLLRARIARFDVMNLPTDGRGLFPLRGLDVGLDGQADPTLGLLTIL